MINVDPCLAQAGAEAIDAAEEFTETLEQAIVRLAQLSPIEYDVCRLAEANKRGIRVSTLDAEVDRRRPAGAADDDAQGRAVSWPEVAPHPLPVDGASLLADLAAAVLCYLAMPAAAADAVALWVLHCHAHDAAEHSAILAITSPEKRCGKSTLLRVLQALVPKVMPSANVTPSAVFRSIAKWKPTLLIDEADTFLRDNEDLRGVLNSGHCRGMAFVTRTVGDDHEPRQFPTWCPKAIAAIGKLPGTLEDRALVIALQRKGAGEATERFRDRGPAADALTALHRRCVRWAADHATRLADADPELPDALHDRAADNWRALVAIADAAGGEWPKRARATALALSGGGGDDASARVMLLADIKAVFEERRSVRITSADLTGALAEMEDRPWPEWQHGRPITPRQVARLLAAFGIKPKLVRVGDAPARGYERAQFEAVWRRYLPSAPIPPNRSVTPLQANDINGLDRKRSVTRAAGVTDEKAEISNDFNDVTDVTDQSPCTGERGAVTDHDDFQPTCLTPDEWADLTRDPFEMRGGRR